MKIALILLPVCLFAIVVYGQESKAKRSANESAPSKATQKSGDSSDWAVVVVNEQTSERQTDNHSKQTESYFSRLLSPENLPNIALVIVGTIGTIIALRTLKIIRRQTDALVHGQRPHIAAMPSDNPAQNLMGSEPYIKIGISNTGLTPAYDVLYESWIEVMQPPFVDFTSNADHYESKDKLVLYPDHRPMIVTIPIRAGLTAAQRQELKNLRLVAYVRIRVTYRDAFSEKRRFADFGYDVQAKGLGFLSKYNDAD